MYVSTSQIIVSLERLKELHPFFGYAFFGFKKAGLPVGKSMPFGYGAIRELVLEKYYKPIESFNGFFNPFKSNKVWVGSRYDTTSLQRVIADTFGSAFLHEKGSGHWGWKKDYIEVLEELMERHGSAKIPLLDLAVWLYRDDGDIPNGVEAVHYLVTKAVREFHIEPEEAKALFVTLRGRAVTLSPEAPDLNMVWAEVGWPPGFREEEGVVLEYLDLTDVGPAREMGYFPKERLNVLTGDNSLGKTFLLDCAWWALTGNWPTYEAEPRRAAEVRRAEIGYALRTHSGRVAAAEAPYNRLDENWQRPLEQAEGIGIYASHSGAFALWDPVRPPNEPKSFADASTHLVLQRDQVWRGLGREDIRGRSVQILNGLIHDWAMWQSSPDKYGSKLKAFERCLRELSPPEGPPLRPGALTRIASDSREFPSIKMPYGDVPVVYASAGVQRIIALAYVLVWHWTEHLSRCARSGREPFKRMVVIVDEIEAHLHPRWQRRILPALLKTLKSVAPDVKVQVHVSTHSPIVLTSLEPEFRTSTDAIHHLCLEDDEVELEEMHVFKHGTVDAWLESDIFGLSSARSIEAEKAIEEAKAVQLERRPSKGSVVDVHRKLLKLLPDDDTFWVRWLYFAETSGAVEGPTRATD
jgi:hypothetical protein